MAKKHLTDLQFPSAGLDKSASFQQQAPYTSPDMLNVRSYDALEGRARGGSRPGFTKSFPDELGSGSPVRLLAPVTTVGSDTGSMYTYWSDEFNRNGTTLGNGWSTPSWLTDQPDTKTSFGGSYASDGTVGAVRDAMEFSDDHVYEIGLLILPYGGEHHGTYHVFARMDDTTPVVTTDGIDAALTLSGSTGTYSGSLTVYVGGASSTHTFTGGSIGSSVAAFFRVRINGNVVTCYWDNNTLISRTVSVAKGKRVGFGIEPVSEHPDICIVESFRVWGTPENTTSSAIRDYRTYLIASAGGSVYKNTSFGSLTSFGSVGLSSDRTMTSAQYAQKLYVADWSPPRVNGTDGIIDSSGTGLTATGVSDWTALSIEADEDVVVITDVSDEDTMTAGTYAISSVAAGQLTLARSLGDAGTCSYRVVRAPKVIDPVLSTVSVHTSTEGSGTVPGGCPLVCAYRNRIVYAGSEDNPHLWYMSRVDDPNDWDYGQDDASRAIAGSNADSGGIGRPITALIPHSDDYLVFGCIDSLWKLSGDPAYSGFIDAIDRSVGVISAHAWCYGPAGEVYILTPADGLYMIPPGASGVSHMVSRNRLPDAMRGIDPAQVDVFLAYDPEWHGVYVYLTSRDGAWRTHYFYDIRRQGFFPDSYGGDYQPTAACTYQSEIADEARLLVGSYDGFVRRYDRNKATDDGSSVSSHVMYGPIRLGGSSYRHGIMQQIIGDMATGSGDITFGIYVDQTHQEAAEASAFATGTWTGGGRQYTDRQRAQGGSFIVRLSNGDSAPWAIEGVTVVSVDGGAQRIG